MLGQIDINKAPLRPVLSICKPNGVKIAELREAHDITNDIFLGKINELQFLVGYNIESKHELIPNPNIAKLKQRYLIKLEQGNVTEWYVINNVYDNADSEKSEKTVHCYSLGWEMNDKLIRGYQATSINATTALNDALLETTWGIKSVDADFDISFRSFDVPEKTVLDFVLEIASTFNAIVEFDTVNRLVSLKKEDSIGQNKGLRLSYGKYLQSLTKQSFSDEMVSRLHVFGNEDLSIQNLNMTGTTFLENFSYFLYPYEEDINGNVIKHSEYMSDNLCKKQLAYQDLIATRNPTFQTYLTQLEQYQTTLATLEAQMSTLQNEKKIIEDQIYLAKGMEQSTTLLDAQLSAKQVEINNKQAEIDTANANITTVNNNITTLRNEVAIENNFTADEIKERNYYIIEKTWQDDNYINEKDLYDEAIKRFTEMKEPKTTFTIDIVNFLSIVEEQRNWDKLSIGDTVTIEYEQLGINITAKIIEIHVNYEDDSISLTIANTKDILNETIKLAKKIYDAYSTSTSLDMSKYKWDNSVAQLGEVNQIINNSWDSAKREILAGVNNSISISGKGIVVTEPNNPNNQVVIQSGIIALSGDAGNTWKTAIRSTGIVAERLFGKIIAGVNLIIQNQSGNYVIDGNGFNITRSDDKVKIGINVADGIKIQSKDVYGAYQDKFYVDINGDLVANDITANNGTFNGTINATGGTFTGTITANSFTLNGGSFNAPTITGGSINIGNSVFTVDTSGNMIATSGTFSGTVSAGTITGSSISGGTISGTSITGGSIVIGTNNKTIINELGIKYAKDNSNAYYTELDSNGLTFKDFYNRMYLDISNGDLTFTSDLTSKGVYINPTLYANNIYMGGNYVATQSWVQSQGYSTGTNNSFSTIYANDVVTNATNIYLRTYGNVRVKDPSDTSYMPIAASSFDVASNMDYKKNIIDYTGDALNEIITTPIREYNFNWELDTEKKHVGVILQESPVDIAVITGEGVDVYAMVSMAWKAIQQLNIKLEDKIALLWTTIQQILTKYEELNTKVNELEQRIIVLEGN